MDQHRIRDLLFLTMIVFASVVPYVWRVGFYSDDWATLGLLINSPDQSLSGLLAALYDLHYKLRMRPTQLVYEAVLFKAFGLNPLGYHLVNATVLTLLCLLLYLVLREFGIRRMIALAVSIVYILLPNYSTDRFWVVAFSYTLTTALFLASTYAFLRATHSRRVLSWAVAAHLALATAALGMEVVIPLTLFLCVALYWRSWLAPAGLRSRLGTRPTILFVFSPAALVIGVSLFKIALAKAAAVQGFSVFGVMYVAWLTAGSLAVNFGTYGLALPHTIAWSLGQLPSSGAWLACALGVVVFLYLSRIETVPEAPPFWTKLVLAGSVIFGLGTAIFLVTPQVLFWSTGIANRTWIAAGLGYALVLVGGSGWVSARVSHGRRRWVFSGMITSLCVSGFVINTAISTYWIAAWPRQLEVLGDIRRALPQLPSHAIVLLDGVCPYLGPAIVFESSWDLRGALQVVYHDPSLQADVTTGRFSIGPDSVSTGIYNVSSSYRYGEDLFVFNGEENTAVRLAHAEIAHAVLGGRTGCPKGIPGRGTVALPFDTWFARAEARGLRPWR
jgi:hypothetical protein